MPNIVQAEFFHVGGKNTESLEDLFEEIGERVKENFPLARAGIETGTGIKIAVRFFDQDNQLTDLTKKLQSLEDHYTATLDVLGTSAPNTWRRWYLGWCLRRIGKQKSALSEKVEREAVAACVASLQLRELFAVEQMDRSYRAIKPEERHDFQEKAQGAKRVWLFIFEPNDLYADKNKLVATML